MAKYPVPAYSKTKADKAGEVLRKLSPAKLDDLDDQSRTVIHNFRVSHNHVLNTFYVTLKGRAEKAYKAALVAQRLKRMPSIAAKLAAGHMRLSQMQDVAGCRAVMSNVDQVDALAWRYLDDSRSTHALFGVDDYIATPKADGYRSLHLIYRYKSASQKNSVYDGFFVEVQLRSKLQHAWATAVEMASTFTGQALKGGAGGEEWIRFFVLMSAALALREKTALPAGVAESEIDLFTELGSLALALGAAGKFQAWRSAIKTHETGIAGARVYLLTLDSIESILKIQGFKRRASASLALTNAEKQTAGQPGVQVALVSAQSVEKLRKAYPNYYVDARIFVEAIDEAIQHAGALHAARS